MRTDHIKLGLKENWKQFSLLVIVNAFVGGMVGMERSTMPQLAENEFGIKANTAILSFIILFGISKAITNYFTGILSNKYGRKRMLVLGWLIGIPFPFILIYTHSWGWIVFANIILGVNQGLTWSSTVVMKIDLVGERRRGLAMGLNEFAGYLSVAVVAFFTSWIAEKYGIRPYPFYIGIFLVGIGTLISVFFIKDTGDHVMKESLDSQVRRLKNVFWETTWKDKSLGSVTQAGLINNLNDGMMWGVMPIWLLTKNFSLSQMGIIISVYPAVWGLGQLLTGTLADKLSKKKMLQMGMLVQAIAILLFLWASTFFDFVLLSGALGVGTAMVYPTFLASIAENTHPSDRAGSLGVFRLWRDLGYAIGAIITGLLADAFNIEMSIAFIALLTFLSALVLFFRMPDSGNVKVLNHLDDPKSCITKDELVRILVERPKQVVFIDVRSKEEYDAMHIPGALNFSSGSMDAFLNSLSKNVFIVTVCGKGGGRSEIAAGQIRTQGFHSARSLCGGTFGWNTVAQDAA